MNILDIMTVLTSYVISNGICLLVIALLWQQNFRRILGLGLILTDFILQFLGLVLVVMRGRVPDFLSIVVANIFVVGGTMLLYVGLERYTGKRSPQWHNIAFILVFMGAYYHFAFLQPSMQMRNILGSVGLVWICGQCAWLLLKRVDRSLRKTTGVVGGVLLTYAAVALLRIFIDSFVPQGTELFSTGIFDTLVILTYQMLFIWLTFSLFLMVNGRQLEEKEADNQMFRDGQADLVISEEKFHLAFQNMPDILTLTSLTDGKILEVNRAFFEISGYTAEEIAGNNTITLQLWAKPEARSEFTKRLLNESRVLNFESQFRKKSGELFTGWISGEILSIHGQMYVLSIIHDVTEKIAAEKALQESEENYRTVAEFTYDWEYWVDPRGKMKYVSPSCERITGYCKEEFIADPGLMKAIILADDLHLYEQHEIEQESISGHRGVHDVDFRITRKDGEMRWIHHSCLLIFRQDGTELGRRGTNRDITDRKNIENALTEHHATLNAIQESTHTPIFSLDREYRYTAFNSAHAEVMKALYGAEIQTGHKMSEFQSVTADWENARLNLDRALAGERVVEAAYSSDEALTRRFFEISHNPVRTESGEVIGVSVFVADLTERKRSEDALARSEKELQDIYQTMTEMLAVHEVIYGKDGKAADYRILKVNPAYERILGIPREKAEGALASELYGAGEPPFLDQYAKVAESGIAEEFEIEFSPLEKNFHISVFSPEKGYFATVSMDITDRVRADKNLRETRDYLQNLFDSANAPIIVWDPEFKITRFNHAYEHLTGRAEEEVLGKHLAVLFPEESRERYLDLIATTLMGERWDTVEIPILHTDGSIRIVLWNSANILAEDGKRVSATIAQGQDITERIKAEDEVHRLSLFPMQNPSPILRIAKDGKILYANQASDPLFSTWGSKVGEILPEVWRDHTLRVFETGKSGEVELKCQDMVFSLLYVPIREEGYINIYGRDITEKKQAEEMLRTYSEKLEETVEERTSELREVQEKLVRQERLAVLGQLAGSVGHELRNPLGVISNAVYFLTTSQPDASEKVKQYLDIIEKETRIADKIIGDLLDFSRIKTVNRKPVSAGELIRNVLVRTPAPEMVKIVQKLPADLPLVSVDPDQINQVLGNLVLNAYQAMPVGGKITFSARQEGEEIAIAVRDSGDGIQPEVMSKLFQPLFTTKINGIGLGLPICKNLVEANGGHIEVQSEPGKGSTFTVFLPMFKESL